MQVIGTKKRGVYTLADRNSNQPVANFLLRTGQATKRETLDFTFPNSTHTEFGYALLSPYALLRKIGLIFQPVGASVFFTKIQAASCPSRARIGTATFINQGPGEILTLTGRNLSFPGRSWVENLNSVSGRLEPERPYRARPST